jgi:hypothetical protein
MDLLYDDVEVEQQADVYRQHPINKPEVSLIEAA